MRTAVIYVSKTGYTKRYAEWIAEELTADLYEASDISPEKLKKYDAVVYGGGLYTGGINGFNKWFRKNREQIKSKKVAVFGVGISPVQETEESTPKDMAQEPSTSMSFFYLRGGLDMQHLTRRDRIFMNMILKKIAKKDPKELTEYERIVHSVGKRPADFTRKKTIKDIVDYMKEEIPAQI